MNRKFQLAAIFIVSSVTSSALAEGETSLTIKDLAGVYLQGTDARNNGTLTLSTNGDFVFECQNDPPISDPRFYGEAAIRNGQLELASTEPLIHAPAHNYYPSEFYPVRWGDRLYLVPNRNGQYVPDFCILVNAGVEPRNHPLGEFFLRQADWKKPALGQPNVPTSFAKYIFSQPLQGKIILLVGETEAWIDIGTKDSVFVGTYLMGQDRQGTTKLMATVSKTEERRSLIGHAFGFAVGQTLFTRRHD